MSPGWRLPTPEGWIEQVWAALAEDVGTGDLSSVCLDPDRLVSYDIEAQADGIVCGLGMAYALLQPDGDDANDASCRVHLTDGDAVRPGDRLVSGRLDPVSLLTRERTALNFLMHLSGVATLTNRFVQKVQDLPVSIVDTRKTVPGLRSLQKYAVRCGGGRNHRMGLYDGVMIKDNHIAACGSIKEAVRRARAVTSHMARIEVECANLEMVAEAIECDADVVMLDNMDPFTMQEAVRNYRGRTLFEASGGITLDTVRGVATTGVDLISVGSLTHSAPALAMHLEVRES